MRRVILDDIMGPTRYFGLRDEQRRHIIDLKRVRRVLLGDAVSLVFENFDTVRFQTQEMVFVERITDLDLLRKEIETYNDLLPDPGELSATLLVEITEQEQIRPMLESLIGLDEHVRLEIDGVAVPAVFEPGRSREDKISAVQYLRFRLDPPVQQALGRPGTRVELIADHPNYQHRAALDEVQRAALAEDFAG